jgi:hypothetical protein
MPQPDMIMMIMASALVQCINRTGSGCSLGGKLVPRDFLRISSLLAEIGATSV